MGGFADEEDAPSVFAEGAHLCKLLDALYENENICLRELDIWASETEFDSILIESICNLIQSDSHRIQKLLLNTKFRSKYAVGGYKVDGFDKLCHCITNKENELNEIKIRDIVRDDDYDVFGEHVFKLIEECNVWMSSIVIRYDNDKLSSSMPDVIRSFLNHLRTVYLSLQCAENELYKIFKMRDVTNIILDFCKKECFELYIDDLSGNDDALNDERKEFKNCLLYHDFFAQNDSDFIDANSDSSKQRALNREKKKTF